MAQDIFRKAALDRMASPERTDHSLRLVGPSGWLIMACFFIAILGGVIWAFQTQAPVKIRAQGILIDQAGLVEIASEKGGLLDEVRIKPGDTVAAGDVVATLSRSGLRRELIGLEAELEDLQDRYRQLAIANTARTERESAADRNRLATIEQTRVALEGRLTLLTNRADKLAPLAERNVVPELRLIEAQIAVSDVQERIAALGEDAQKIGLDAAERTSQREIELLEDNLAIEAKTREISRLNAQLSNEQVVRTSHQGQVVEIKVNPGDVLDPGSALATLAPIDLGRSLQALMYVPPADGKRVTLGMIAEISPTTVEREVYGHILAEVVSVAPLPATPEGMRRVLQNDQLVEQLSLGGAPIEVRLALRRDPKTATGFEWSSSGGPVNGVNAGTLLDGKVIVESRPLIDLVIPGASHALPGGQKAPEN